MKKIASFLIVILLSSFSSSSLVSAQALLGFTDASSETQEALEDRFDAVLNAENLDTWMRHLTAKPQHVGSPQGKANAEYVAGLFESWGYDVEIEVFQVLFPTPAERVVELTSPTRLQLVLDEPAIPEDESSSVREDMLPPYNAYSADGDIEAELVYVNQGIPGDYEVLERMGISVEGKIVLARYGGSWRGIKPKVAYEHGAIGCILYSDPRDDGYFQGDVYPVGAFRSGMGAQRGSVADMPLYPGDPLTPFVGAKEDTDRYTPEESPTVMKIPVIPISYDNALPLLRAIGGPVAPERWRGALPLTYHVGPGPARVHLKLKFNWDLVPAYDVIARLPGSEFPDEWIMRGNHRDGWVFGAADPTSGHVAMMEEARAIGELVRSGWRPKRTIIYASWDGEEPGLLGSTEWVEYHADELNGKGVVYINTDSNGRGFLGVGGSHTLQSFINEIARDVEDPQTGVTVFERSIALRKVNGTLEHDHSGDIPISPLGSGSDYGPFLQYAGISSLNLGFGGENRGGSYHSAYDSYEYYTRFGDSDFMYGVTLAKVSGRATLRLAQADVLPFRFGSLAENIRKYLDEVKELADETREKTETDNSLIASGAYKLAADPTKPYVPPVEESAVPFLNFAPLENAFSELENAAEEADGSLTSATPSVEMNFMLAQVERAMTSKDGLPRRPWFRHQVYAPGFYTGYGVKTLPGVREAIEERKWDEAEAEIKRTAEMLGRVAKALNEIAAQAE
ncbi:MAG: transferrin receptor-like dimerization domain-containing protein [Rhodothermia bacterium]|nr:MAG: transferrin receptor-like dimerization domain-containing protein [Rhodothermia bacterium]